MKIHFSSKNGIIKHLLYWVLFVCFFTLVWGTYDYDYFTHFMVQVLNLPARLTLVYVTLFFLFPKFFLKKKHTEFVLLYILLLVIVTVFIQRPIFVYITHPLYLPAFKATSYFAISELMNTLLNVNIALIIPLGYTLFKSWQETHQRATELEKKQAEEPEESDFIYLKVQKSLEKVFIKDIIFVESLKNYIKVKTIYREITAYKSISSIEEALSDKTFLRVHRSYIVNLDFIDSFSPTKLVLRGTEIPIGRTYKENTKEILGYT